MDYIISIFIYGVHKTIVKQSLIYNPVNIRWQKISLKKKVPSLLQPEPVQKPSSKKFISLNVLKGYIKLCRKMNYENTPYHIIYST